MNERTTKIDVIEEAEATGELKEVYQNWQKQTGRGAVPGILQCFSHRPDFLADVIQFSNRVHFSEGHLTRRMKESIASWVSALNRCPY